MSDHGIRIIGSGCAGMGAAWQLHKSGMEPIVYEKLDRPGGHTCTHVFEDGFVFDEGPHISFTKIDRIIELFAESVGQDYFAFSANVNNYWQGHWIKHPAQVNLNGLPLDLTVSCIQDFIRAQNVQEHQINNYEDWLYASFGRTFAETFPMEYTKKYHTTEAKNLTTDWLGPRLYQPEIEEVLRGALTAETPNVHYIPSFRYPSHGGFVSYLNMFQKVSDIRLNHNVVEIDIHSKTVTFADGSVAAFEHLISSVALPVLISLIPSAPEDVRQAAKKLSCSQTVLVNIGLKREEVTDQHWTYFYDEEYPFSRLSFPHKYSPNCVPAGHCSIQAEIYFSDKWKPFNGSPEALIAPTIDGLMRCGLITDPNDIVHTSTLFAPWGNVIFDHDRAPALEVVHGFLEDVGIHYCGRYGDWAYIWTDESFISGENAAKNVIERL